MIVLPHLAWLLAVLRRVPTPLTILLDAWSYRVARKRAERRRQRAAARKLSAQE